MSTQHVNVAIIGAGTAGLKARRTAKAQGATALLIDPGPFGTTCARVGCMPSKLLIAAANAAHNCKKADVFGIEAGPIKVDGPKVMARVQFERDRFVGFVKESIESIKDAGELIEGRARIVEPGKLHVDVQGNDHEVTYDRLVLAVGSTPFIPPPYRDIGDHLLTNEQVFELKDLPGSLLVVGLGVIGLELGQAMHRLGVRTTLLGVRHNVGPLSDPDLIKRAGGILSDELDMHPHHELTSVAVEDGHVRVIFVDSTGKRRDEKFEHVLIASGQRSNLTHLGLNNLGIEPDERGNYAIDPKTLQLSDAPVFVAGDANKLHPLLHEAADDGEFAGLNAANYPDIQPFERRTGLGIVFCSPQIGIVGQSWSELKDQDIVTGEVSYHNQGRARVDGKNKGMVHIYGDRQTGRLLGAELIGPAVEHTSHLLAWAIQNQMTVTQALEMPFYHPVVEEGIRTALRDLAKNIQDAQN